jgi:hypothetical protein
MPLNGAAGNTEGGRLSRLMRTTRMCYSGSLVSSGGAPCYVKESIQTPITPTENSRITLLNATMNGTLLNGGGVTQARARQILAAAAGPSYESPSVYTNALQQKTIACSDDSPTLKPIIIPACPPLPPPPGPPAPKCILAKNQKY